MNNKEMFALIAAMSLIIVLIISGIKGWHSVAYVRAGDIIFLKKCIAEAKKVNIPEFRSEFNKEYSDDMKDGKISYSEFFSILDFCPQTKRDRKIKE